MLTHRIKSEVGSEPKIIHLTAVRSRTPGWSAGISLTHSLLVCLSFPPLLFISASLFHTLPLLSLYSLLSRSLRLTFCCYFFEKHASPASKPPQKNQDKSRKQFSSFFFASPPLPIFWLSLFQSQLFSLKVCHWETHMALKDHFKSNKQLSSERESRVSMGHFKSTSKARERRGIRIGKGGW